METLTATKLLEGVAARRERLKAAHAGGKLDFPSLRHFAFPRKGGRSLGYADPAAKLLSTDTGRASATFVISTACKDRVGDVMVPGGLLPHLAHFKANPRVFFAHKSYWLPVGSARDPGTGECTVKVFDDRVEATVYFHLLTEESEQIYTFVAAKELEATSIGFLPVKGHFTERATRPEQRSEVDFTNDTFVFDEWDMTEFSVVPVPCNPEAVQLWLSDGVGGKALAPALRKSFEPYAPAKKIWAPGVDLDEEEEEPAPCLKTVSDIAAAAISPPSSASPVSAPTTNPTTPPHAMTDTPKTPQELIAAAKLLLDDACKGNQLTYKLDVTDKPSSPASPPASSVTPPELAAVKDMTQNPSTGAAPAHDPKAPYGHHALMVTCAALQGVHKAVGELMPPLEHKQVKRHLEKLMKRLLDHHGDAMECSEEHYPEQHGKPANPDGDADDKPKELPADVVQKQAPPPADAIDWQTVLAAFDRVDTAVKETNDRFFRLTGQRVGNV